MQSLLELAISGRHWFLRYLRLLKQSYSIIPQNLRKQTEAIFIWCPKERADLKRVCNENNVLTDAELVIVRGLLKKLKHACLYIQNEDPCGFKYLK